MNISLWNMIGKFLFTNIASFLAQDIVFYTISTISTSIISIQNIEKFIGKNSNYSNYSNCFNYSNSNYEELQIFMEKNDLINKLIITIGIIKDIIKKHSDSKQIDFDKIFDMANMNFMSKTINDDDYQIINIDYSHIVVDIPEPVKISILSTLEIIHKLNIVFDSIHKKIIQYSNSYFNFYGLNVGNEIKHITFYNEIFNSRLNLLLSVINIYNQKLQNNKF